MESIAVPEKKFIYTTDIFIKYRDINKINHPNFSKYYLDFTHNKVKKDNNFDIFGKNDICCKLNYIINGKNIINDDEKLYSIMRYNLNKVNNKMLNKNDTGLQASIEILTNLTYTKLDHFKNLAEMIIDKATNEHKFCEIYAMICAELSPYYIETGPGKKIYFRHSLIDICEQTFGNYISNCDKIEKEKIIGLATFLGELYNKKLLTPAIIRGCFDRLGNNIEKHNNASEGLSAIVIACYKTLHYENRAVADYMIGKLNIFVENTKLHLKSKFAMQNAIEYIEEYNASC